MSELAYRPTNTARPIWQDNVKDGIANVLLCDVGSTNWRIHPGEHQIRVYMLPGSGLSQQGVWCLFGQPNP